MSFRAARLAGLAVALYAAANPFFVHVREEGETARVCGCFEFPSEGGLGIRWLEVQQAQALESPASRVSASGKKLQRPHRSELGANRFNGQLECLFILEWRKAVLERAIQLRGRYKFPIRRVTA